MTIERGSDKHGPRTDDGLAGEVEGLVRSGHSTHAEEWKDPEPSGEDQPTADLSAEGTLTGGTPAGVDAGDVEGRSELASYLGKEVWPATADALREVAVERQATDRVLQEIARLPQDREYANVQEVWEALGGGREQRF
ncbi:uncharacterized protein DUF2795 [Motilibacter rhizosphaerae]|uniref:Uncharacterized protein DUF2795 n=1 Tax=Motilibacter rhizosphaerae TaxID=598652 RepID=A0A4Q7NPC4_9ACTN|nr:DUF2795 domain-containing protein [Motilibacter rhizosphaerae]RZS87125.1 uncharacterized protein DUF2795 [Motilibacter rhizosphaerae]